MAVVTALAIQAVTPSARSGASTYNTRTETIRCGVLLANRSAWANAQPVTTQALDMNHTFSYVFHALNARPDIRPYAWEIVNPNAPPYMDSSSAKRWGLTATQFNVANPPRLNKNMGAYWEVFLKEATADQLANYDVLYMPLPLNDGAGASALTIEDREKLRRAVDGGVLLWIDNPNSSAYSPGDDLGRKLFVQPTFRVGGSAPRVGDPLEALLSTPNTLSAREIRSLGTPPDTYFEVPAGVPIDGSPRNPSPGSFVASWRQVAVNTRGTLIAVTPYGQGGIVITSRGVGRALSEGFRPVAGVDGAMYRRGNTGPVSGSDARLVQTPELKFLVNLIAYKFQNPQPGGGPRHASGTRQDMNTPLGRKWQFPENFVNKPGGFSYAGVHFVSEPAVWNGVAFVAGSDGKLYAFDMDPGRDIDGDSNPDDGLPNPDHPSSDVLWVYNLPGPCSSVVVGDVHGETRLFLTVNGGNKARILSLSALPRNGGRLSPDVSSTAKSVDIDGFAAYPQWLKGRIANGYVPNEDSAFRIPAPVYYSGRLFVVGKRSKTQDATTQGIGAVAEIDPVTLKTLWQFPDGTQPSGGVQPLPGASRMGLPSATPTIAAVQDKGYSGATDIMLLVSCHSIGNNRAADEGAATQQASRVVAFPIAVRGERLLSQTRDGVTRYWTRFAGANSIQATNARVWINSQSSPLLGTVGVDTSSPLNRMYVDALVPMGDSSNARADYDFTPGPAANGFAGYNARWSFDAWSYQSLTAPRYMEILTSPVVSPQGTIYVVASDLGEGEGQSPLVMGLEIRTPAYSVNTTTSTGNMVPLTTPQLTFMYALGSTSQGLIGATSPIISLGTPAWDRGVLYVPSGRWNSQVSGSGADSTGDVTGFYVQDSRFGLLLSMPVDMTQRSGITLSQRNRYTGELQVIGTSGGLFDVDNVNYQGTLRGLLTFRALSAGSGAPSVDLSRVGDLQVTYPALETITGRTNPMTDTSVSLFFRTQRGEGTGSNILIAFNASVPSKLGRGGIRTGVTVAGSSIYVGADDGEVYTVPLPNDLDLLTGTASGTMRPATFPSLATSAGYKWGKYPVGAELRASPVIANNTLIQNAPVGVYTFYAPRTLITDSNRIVEVVSAYTTDFDNAGNAASQWFGGNGSQVVWSLDSTTQTMQYSKPGAGPNHGPWAEGHLSMPVIKSIKQPSMAIRVNSTNTLICDTGNNRVVEVDKSGRVQWQVSEFADPLGLLGPNEPRTLSSPTSVQRWESYDFDANDRVSVRVVHNLIVDNGNFRILEIISRYSSDPNEWANNVVVWVGKGPQGSQYQFYQAQREVYTGLDASKRGSLDYGRTIASVVNVSVNSAEVRLGEAPFNNVELGIPATPGGSVVILGGLADGPANGKVVYYLNRISYGNSTEAFPLARPVFFEKYTTGEGSFHWRLMITDGQNVMELTKDAADPAGLARLATSGTNGPIVANEKLGTMTSYGGMGSGGYTVGTVMARRLRNNNILMVNAQTGYVFEYSPDAAEAGSMDTILTFTAPPLRGTSALIRPTYADRLF